MKAVSLLVLDDFGARSATAAQHQAALQILGSRMRMRKPTICTSVGLEELDSASDTGLEGIAGDQSVSRSALLQAHALLLGGFKIVRVGGDDYRARGSDIFDLF